MITTETPYKLAEIIRDTWFQLYYKPQKKNKDDDQNIHSNIRRPIR
jgi:hypothetical protein